MLYNTYGYPSMCSDLRDYGQFYNGQGYSLSRAGNPTKYNNALKKIGACGQKRVYYRVTTPYTRKPLLAEAHNPIMIGFTSLN